LLYSAFTYWLGFKVNSGEYKLMGLAPYGIPDSENVTRFIEVIKSTLVDIHDDGSIWLNQDYFNYAAGLRMANDKKWEEIFGFPRKTGEDELKQIHCDLAFAIQTITEEIVIKIAQEAKRITGSKNLCMAGGVALNCVANGKLLRAGIFDQIFIQPAAGDAGGALGAALAAHYIYYEQERQVTTESDAMAGSYLGPEFSSEAIEEAAKTYGAKFNKHASFDATAEQTAALLSEGNVVGWFQGRMEFGPRSLGNRSILGDARNREMQEKLNLKIKYRESFRPFAPSVLLEDSKQYFDLDTPSPYMLLVADIADQRKAALPEKYHQLPLMDRLYVERSDVPSITHVDFSARVQTVTPDTNKEYYGLISKFKEKTGFGILVNTSFNVRGEPIVCTPDDAYRCFMRTEMDYLVLGDYIFAKTEQPSWDQKDAWQEEFALD
jgi:carbamoyltransferase